MENEHLYPRWMFYPRWSKAPEWVDNLTEAFRQNKARIDSRQVHEKSDAVLALLTPSLQKIGYQVEGGEGTSTIRRPVNFKEYGTPDLTYHIDSYHPQFRIGLEVEAGRSYRGNAIYRDIIQTSLLVDTDYFAIAVPLQYVSNSNGKRVVDQTYEDCKSIMDAIFSSERLKLPFRGVLIIGY